MKLLRELLSEGTQPEVLAELGVVGGIELAHVRQRYKTIFDWNRGTETVTEGYMLRMEKFGDFVADRLIMFLHDAWLDRNLLERVDDGEFKDAARVLLERAQNATWDMTPGEGGRTFTVLAFQDDPLPPATFRSLVTKLVATRPASLPCPYGQR